MNVTADTLARIRLTAEDLSFLRREWEQDVSDASLRRSSPILRRLLVEGVLLRAWRDLGLAKQPTIRACSLEATVKNLALSNIRFAQAGGATYRGVTVTPVIEYSYLPPEQAVKAFQSDPEGPDRDFSLKAFSEGTCIVARGTSISRNTLIKYIANKLGGVHLDLSRDSNKEEERKFSLLDEVRVELITADKPAIYFEYLSIGQSLVKSTDIESFLSMAAHATREFL